MDFSNLVDHLSAPVRTALDSSSFDTETFEPFELTLPALLITLKDAQHSQEFNEK